MRTKIEKSISQMWLAVIILAFVQICAIGIMIDGDSDASVRIDNNAVLIEVLDRHDRKIKDVLDVTETLLQTMHDVDEAFVEHVNDNFNSVVTVLECMNESMMYFHDIDPMAVAEAMGK